MKQQITQKQLEELTDPQLYKLDKMIGLGKKTSLVLPEARMLSIGQMIEILVEKLGTKKWGMHYQPLRRLWSVYKGDYIRYRNSKENLCNSLWEEIKDLL